MGRLYLAIAFASASLGSASVQAAVGPVPQWIWIDAYPGRPQSAWFLRTFDAPAGIERAELMGMADDRMTVYVNGTEVGAVQGTKQAATFDVTGQVRAGVNTLAVEAHNASGPAGVLLRLRIVAVDGREQTIVTDDAWVGTTKPPAEWLQSTFRDTAWPPVVSFGLLGVRPWAAPTGETEAYNQWKQALATGVADAATNIAAMPGFQVELMRSSQGDESSWVSLAFDPQGRITLAREGRSGGKGLLRLTLPESPGGESRMEVLNETLEECRGLLYAHGSLYANANNSRGLYRLRDTDGDDTLDEVKLLRATGGGVGHGRNDLTLGPDGRIYLVHGNNVLLPDDYQPGASPFRNFGPDRLRPCFWDRTLFDAGVEPLAGHVVRTDADGQTWELMAGGFRNAFGLDFNADGELFTYDADMEWDAGAPWYKPTRINHVVSGGEYGFRQGTANRPAYLPDNWPSNLDIGLGSPTSVKFGTHSNFPPRYRRALFVLDWAYGKIYAIHLTPRGASYTCSAEVFVEGRPLNVTDIDFGPDGAMYFTTGGRDTQSGLYRVRYVGPDVADEPNAGAAIQSQLAADARARRRRLEAFHGRVDPAAVDEAWFHLDSPDPWLRNAARVAIEAQPVDAWRGRALAESRPTAALTAMMALARIGGAADQPAIFERLAALSMNELAIEQQLTAVRCYALACARLGRPPAEAAARITAKVGPLFPSRISPLDQQLCELLAYLEAPELVPRTVPLLASSETIEDRLCWLYMLRNVRGGWTPADRQAYFRALASICRRSCRTSAPRRPPG
jgi:glucose/arabinose dehydrogenase